MEDHYFECACHSPEHRLVFTIDKEEGFEQLYTEVFLHNYRPWYRRIWPALRYVFGYKCKYGHFDTFLMKNEDVPRFRKLIDEYYRLIDRENSRNP